MAVRRITTAIADLMLVELSVDDAGDFYRLIDRNRAHLTRYGDYGDLARADLEAVTAALAHPADRNERFGIWLAGELVGRVDLSPRKSGHFVIGYWLGEEYTGNGYVTVACQALIEHAREHLAATDIYAGVTTGNTASEAVLDRLRFQHVEDREGYRLFRLNLESS